MTGVSMDMTIEERREATKTVLAWLEEHHGPEAANHWAWEMTPMPFGLPLDHQLDEGLAMAVAQDPDVVRRAAADRRDAAL